MYKGLSRKELKDIFSSKIGEKIIVKLQKRNKNIIKEYIVDEVSSNIVTLKKKIRSGVYIREGISFNEILSEEFNIVEFK